MSHDRPHRCHACGWRGWGVETSDPISPEEAESSPQPEPDLDVLDEAVTRSANGDTEPLPVPDKRAKASRTKKKG